ncbi:Gfo/Idh/MocA family oxidoreductase [Flindersiella endophytica]
MRLGLVGVGRIGRLHARTLRDLTTVEEVTVADADTVRAEQLAAEHGFRAAPDVRTLLKDADGVVIAAATPAHAELVHQAVEAGVAIFCEKPLASTVAETKEILDKTVNAGIPLQLGFQRRFDAGFLAARNRLRAGELGVLHSIWACTMDPAPPHAGYIPTSGGLFADCSVHDIDAIRWATGREIVSVSATGANKGEGYFAAAGDVDTGHALLTLDDGTLAAIAGGRYNGAGYDVRLELHGARATAVAGLDGVTGTSYPSFAERFGAAYVKELETFVEVAAGRIESPCPGEDALEALYVALACERSRREQRAVRVAEVKQ